MLWNEPNKVVKHNVRIYLILIVEVVTMKWVSAEEEEDLTQEPRRTRGISLNRAALNPSAANLRRHPSSLYRTCHVQGRVQVLYEVLLIKLGIVISLNKQTNIQSLFQYTSIQRPMNKLADSWRWTYKSLEMIASMSLSNNSTISFFPVHLLLSTVHTTRFSWNATFDKTKTSRLRVIRG